MVPDLTLITPTGNRPEAFALCERWMRGQSFRGSVQWIVVDDGAEAISVTMGQVLVRPTPFWRPGAVTLQRNLRAAIPLVKSEKILIIEDDDYYAPGYLQLMADRLDLADLVAETNTHYYHVEFRKHMDCKNINHGSLFQTGIRQVVLPMLQGLCEHASYFLDLGLFSSVRSRRLFPPSGLSMGMKGLPGRGGIGMGHRVRGNQWLPDPNLDWLRAHIGSDVKGYENYGTRTDRTDVLQVAGADALSLPR